MPLLYKESEYQYALAILKIYSHGIKTPVFLAILTDKKDLSPRVAQQIVQQMLDKGDAELNTHMDLVPRNPSQLTMAL